MREKYGNCDIGSLRIQPCHPILGTQQVPEKVEALNLEVAKHQPLVEFIQVDDGLKTPFPFSTRYRLLSKPVGCTLMKEIAPFASKAATSLSMRGLLVGECDRMQESDQSEEAVEFYLESPHFLQFPCICHYCVPVVCEIC